MRIFWAILAVLFLGVIACPAWASAGAEVLECNSCDSCNSQIQIAQPGDTIQLNSSMLNQPQTCINLSGRDDLILDCHGYTIGGNGSPGSYGIYLNHSSGNTIMNCLVTGFSYGIYLNSASGNTIYNNMFNNTANFALINGSQNFWNIVLNCISGPSIVGGPCMGGNYWAAPSGSGFSQTCPDSDRNGICDSLYVLDSSNADYLPLRISDATPPALAFVAPQNNTQTNETWILINVSANELLSSCILNWNSGSLSSNESFLPAGPFCSINKTSLAGGTYTFKVYANDSAGNWNSTETRYITASPPMLPLYIIHSINPRSIATGSSTAISINVTSTGTIDKIILSISMPNSSTQAFPLSGNATMNYTSPIPGVYTLMIFANTTQGYNSTLTDNFTASGTALFNSTVITYNSTGIPAGLELLYPGTGTRIYEFSSGTGSFRNLQVLQQSYDMLFKTYSEKLQVTLRNVNITQNLNREIGFDNPQVQNYAITYSVNSTYTSSSSPFAFVKIYYSGQTGLNEDHIGLYKCEFWNFAGRSCLGIWETQSFSQDKSSDYVFFNVSSFSAFSLKQEPFCGDGACQPGENASNCSADCDCQEGEKMECKAGGCSGNLTCQNGKWGTQCEGITPNPEACNRIDDNCDVIVDNVNNGTSALSSQCQCYGNQQPLNETCNGIDDDCNGIIDDNAGCCANGETRECGSSTGLCSPGTSTCSEGLWGPCLGSTGPASEECGNGIDDDCDGQADEDCETCSDLDGDGYGIPASNACLYSELDCADADPGINPGSAEICDGKDNNCDGQADEGLECASCSNGKQDGSETGADCGGECSPCPFYTSIWFYVSVAGAAILGPLLFMYFRLRKHGKELTWEELMKKWTPSR